ncbi:fatty acid desaturase [Musa troglodytarum]|nr:fatty acid desaturase [Musa troglodytarum]
MYLAFNISGRPYPRFACHFDPYGAIFSDHEWAQIFISDAGLMATSSPSGFAAGLRPVVARCLACRAILSGWLVLITYCRTRAALPPRLGEWGWLRGHRDGGRGLRCTTWCSTTSRTPVAHHLFSAMRTTTPWRRPGSSSHSLASTTDSAGLRC